MSPHTQSHACAHTALSRILKTVLNIENTEETTLFFFCREWSKSAPLLMIMEGVWPPCSDGRGLWRREGLHGAGELHTAGVHVVQPLALLGGHVRLRRC